MTGVLLRREETRTQGRRQCEDRHRGCSDVSTSQGLQAATKSWEEVRKDRSLDSS